jgi:diguanylate cyclase (GGDEF)-like protein
MVDIDHFKLVNDTHGHQVGDQVLREVAATIKSVSETRGSCYRYGGEEIAILLSNHSLSESSILAERIRVRIEQSTHSAVGVVTASQGIACHPETTAKKDANELLADADKALYRAKHDGRNRVCLAATIS